MTGDETIKTGFVLTEDRKKIYYDHHQNGFKNLVVIAHGFFNSRKSVLLRELGDILGKDYDVLLMDFRGHGESQGLFHWTSRETLDLTVILEYARPQYKKIGVIGFSLGAATSLIVAAKTSLLDSLVAVSSPSEFLKIEYHFWQLDWENDIFYNLGREGSAGKGVRPGPFWLAKEAPIKVVSGIRCPVFYIHGESDWLIKPWHSQILHEKTKAPKKLSILKNGPHAEYLIRKNKEETIRLIRDWLSKNGG